MFKINAKGVEALYKFAMSGPHTKDIKILTIMDCVYIVKNAGAGWESDEYVRMTGLSYSLSKMTIIDDMEDFDNYNKMLKVEFYEFLGRLAEQIYKRDENLEEGEEDVPLCEKLAKLLTILIEAHTTFKFIQPEEDNELETESDDEDEDVEQAKTEIITKEVQNKRGFWRLKD